MLGPHEPDPSVTDHLRESARRALAAGDLMSAMQHAAELLKFDPLVSEACVLIDEISCASTAPLTLAPQLPGPSALALAAARLHILFFLDEKREALAHFCRIVRVAPMGALFGVLQRAITPAFVAAIGLPGLRPLITKLTQYAFPVAVLAELDDPRLPYVRVAAEILTMIRLEHPDQPDLYAAEVLVRRRLPDHETTLAVASLAVERFPENWLCLTALAHALGDAHRPHEAAVYAYRALESEALAGSSSEPGT